MIDAKLQNCLSSQLLVKATDAVTLVISQLSVHIHPDVRPLTGDLHADELVFAFKFAIMLSSIQWFCLRLTRGLEVTHLQFIHHLLQLGLQACQSRPVSNLDPSEYPAEGHVQGIC